MEIIRLQRSIGLRVGTRQLVLMRRLWPADGLPVGLLRLRRGWGVRVGMWQFVVHRRPGPLR